MLLPQVIYQATPVPVEVRIPDVTTGVTLGLVGDGERLMPSVVFTQDASDSEKWTGTLDVPISFPLGDADWQVFYDSRFHSSGTVTVAAGLTSTTLRTPNEARLKAVETAIDKLIKTGTAQFSISGNVTTKLSLDKLRAERLYLSNLVNKERKLRGLKPLPGSMPGHTTFTYGV